MEKHLSGLKLHCQTLYDIDKENFGFNRLLGGRPRSSIKALTYKDSFFDSVFVVYEFPNETEKLKWEESLPEFAKNSILPSCSWVVQQYGWNPPEIGPEWEGQMNDENYSCLVVGGGAREAQEVFQTYKPKKYKRIDLFPLANRPETLILFQFEWAEEREVWEAGLPPVVKGWINREKICVGKSFRKP